MNGLALNPSHFSLFSYLNTYPKTKVVYFAAQDEDIHTRQIFNSKIVIPEDDWSNPSFWRSLPENIRQEQPGIAVFDTLREKIPAAAFPSLSSIGVKKILTKDQNDWIKLSIGPLPRFLNQLVSKRFTSIGARIRYPLERILRKAVLKFFSRDLHDAGVVLYHSQDGNCFRATIQELAPFADYDDVKQDKVFLFEEITRLTPHQPHKDISILGEGRMDHWRNEFFFSATDNSSPNHNGRRYRYFKAIGWKRIFSPLFSLTSPFTAPEALPAGKSTLIPARKPCAFETHFRSRVEADAPRGFERLGAASSEETVLLINSLAPGGAERQLCYLASNLAKKGKKVRVWTWKQNEIENLHYLPLLEKAGVTVEFISAPHPDFSIQPLLDKKTFDELSHFQGMSPLYAHDVWCIYTHLMVLRPKTLHCWLDRPSLVGAMAGWLAGVSRIIMSTRNVNPTHFAYIYQPWYYTWYSLLLKCPRIRLIANSHMGAQSYADWLSVPVSHFNVVHNGVDFDIMQTPTENQVEQFLESHSLSKDTPIIAGVFRFNYEKRPSLFLRVIGELRKEFPNLRALIAGVGPLHSEIKQEIDRRGLTGVVELLGRSDEVATIMRASKLLLLTSAQEGLPNVLMEAQWFKRPVVATNAGGSAEIVLHDQTGFIVSSDNPKELTARCRAFLKDPELCKQFGARGHEYIRDAFSLEKMVDETLKLY